MPVRYVQPDLKEAQVFVGSLVRVYWLQTDDSPEGWYPGKVGKVYWCSEAESGQEAQKRRYLCFHIE